jgi:hypothetical protein
VLSRRRVSSSPLSAGKCRRPHPHQVLSSSSSSGVVVVVLVVAVVLILAVDMVVLVNPHPVVDAGGG